MCSHYEWFASADSCEDFGVAPPPSDEASDLWPGRVGAFIRRHASAEQKEVSRGVFGLIPHWCTDLAFSRRAYNARTETVSVKPAFRDAWRRARHCIIPATAFYEPDWRSGRAVATRISLASGRPMGIAGLWDATVFPNGHQVLSYCMLTINANDHALMNRFHRPGHEKRMIVVLAQDDYGAWLTADAERSMDFMVPCPADALVAEATPG